MRLSKLLILILVCALPFFGKAQTFEWESQNNIYGGSYVKIQETKFGSFFFIGPNYKNVGCYLLNKVGKPIWIVTPKPYSEMLYDYITTDLGETFFIIGYGNPNRNENLFLKINKDGNFQFEKITVGKKYYPLFLQGNPSGNDTYTTGSTTSYNFNFRPIIEKRSLLTGDTIQKFILQTKEVLSGNKIFKTINGNLILFCKDAGSTSGRWGTLIVDTKGTLLKESYWGSNGVNSYKTALSDVIQRDSNYFLLGDISFRPSDGLYKSGNYIYEFNQQGDSVALHPVNLDNLVYYNLKAISATADKGFILAGDVLLKLDSLYQIEWVKKFRKWTDITSVGQAADGGYYGAGMYFKEAEKAYCIYAFKTDAKGNIDKTEIHPNITIYPNPVVDELTLELPYGQKFELN